MKTLGSNNSNSYERALARVTAIKGFYTHLAIYCIFVCVFIYINLMSTSFPWAIFPIVGWGIGVLGHASEAFDYNIFFGKSWEQRKIKELMYEERRNNQF